MKTQNTKKRIMPIFLVALTVPVLFLFTNMKPTNQKISRLVAESRDLQAKMGDPRLSKAGRDFLLAHKRLVMNVLAKEAVVSSCAEMLSLDATMASGKYIFYRNDNLEQPELYQCTVSNKKISKQTFIKSLKNQSVVKKETSIFYKQVTLNQTGGGTHRATIPGTSGLPQVIRLFSSKPCKANTDYGFDSEGIWVKNGCRATFKVPVTAPLKDREIASNKPLSDSIFGAFSFEADKTHLKIQGWACEKGKTPIKVQVYVGGPAGEGQLLTSSEAKNLSEDSVHEKCGTKKGDWGHRFQISLPLSSIKNHKGKELFVHGVAADKTGTLNGELSSNAFKVFNGSNQCGTTTCSLEDPRDKKNGERYMIRNDKNSVNQRCKELGFSAGVPLSLYSHAEWCKYSNANTKFWNGSKWVMSSCNAENVKSARCYNGIP